MESPIRVFTAGNVDDGKSTLIGRLLYDSRSLYEDQLEGMKREGKFDFSLLTDGLLAEREQGITIGVAYRYFSIGNQPFILADAPGHEQYTGSLAAAASDADVLLLLVSVERPLTVQAKRHSVIASLLGIKQVIVAVNKLDLFDYSEELFWQAKKEYEAFAAPLLFDSLSFLPISALKGDNVAALSPSFPWYRGSSLFTYLANLSLGKKRAPYWRFAVQTVLRPLAGGRFYAGTLKGATLRTGDEVVCLPSEQKTKIKAIIHSEKSVEQAEGGQAIALQFETEVDAGRGSALAPSSHLPVTAKELRALVIWVDPAKMVPAASYLLMHMNQTVVTHVQQIHHAIDIETLQPKEAKLLERNEIGLVTLGLQRALFADVYRENRSAGSFILIDSVSHRTVGAGLIESLKPIREEAGIKGRILWLTGLPCSGKTTLGQTLVRQLRDAGHLVYLLDGDILRKGLNADLGFSEKDREENVRRVSEVAALFAEAGFTVIVALVSPFASDRVKARSKVPSDRFWEIYLNTPLATCEARDVKGHYKAARAGQIADFTGISSPYEPPQNPEMILDTSTLSLQSCAEQIVKKLNG